MASADTLPFYKTRLPRRLAALAGATGLAAFLALAVRLLWLSPELKPHLFDAWDPFWLKAYAAAILIMGALVCRGRGKLLLLTAAVAGTTVLLTPMFSGATGWALPKLALIMALAVGIGHRGLKWLALSESLPPLDHLLLSSLLGFGFLSLLMLALGLLHLWRPEIIVAAFLALGAAVRRDLAAVCRRSFDEGIRPLWHIGSAADLRLPALALTSICVCGFGCYLCAAAPNTHWDVLHYHLGIPVIYVERGGIVPLDHTYAVHLVRNAEMLYGLGLLVEGQPLPTLFNFLFGLLALGMVVSLGTLLANRRVGWAAGAIFFAVPLVSYVLAEGMIDIFLTAYVVAAAYAFFRWRRDGEAAWISAFSVFAGLAAGTKISAAIFLAPLAGLMLVGCLQSGLDTRAKLSKLVRLIAPAALLLTPWLALTWVRTGNPFFPFLNNVFRSSEWFQDSISSGTDWPGFGVGKSWWYAPRLPWDLAFHGERFGEYGWFATAGVVLLGLPFGCLSVPKRQRGSMLALTLLTAFSLAVLFKVAQYARYMLPLIAFCAIVAAMNGNAVWRRLSRRPGAKWLPLGACLALGLGWLFFTRAVQLSDVGHFHPGRYPWKLALGSQSPDECLRQSSLTDYEFLKYVKERLPEKPVVFLGIGLGAGAYSGDAIEYSRWHSLAGKRMTEQKSPQRLLSMLREKRVRYLAVNERFVQSNASWKDMMRDAAALRPRFHRRYCEPLFGRNGVMLYRLCFEGLDAAASDEAPSLITTALEPNADGTLLPGWGLATGKLRVLPPGSHPTRPDATAVELTHRQFICQRCPVKDNTLYTLSADFWSAAPGQACMLQLLWVDESGKQTSNEVSQQVVGASPGRFEMSRTSLPGSRFVDVYVRAKDGDTVSMAWPRLIERSTAATPSEAPQADRNRLARLEGRVGRR